MGIKNLTLLVKNLAPNAINEKKLGDYSGKVAAIDTSLFMYKYEYNNGDHLDGLTRQILKLMKYGITPLYIFDGYPPEEKNDTLELRNKRRENLNIQLEDIKNKIINCNNNNEIAELETQKDKIMKRLVHITDKHVELSKKLFDLFGIPYIEADGEAEILCANLSYRGLVDLCITEDSDILANNGKILARNFKPSKNIITEYDLDIILEDMNITYEQFVDICIMLGCDYCPKIYGIGYVNALKLIKKYNNLENIIKMSSIKIPEKFDYQSARNIFISQDDTNYTFNLNKPNSINIVSFLDENSEKLHEKYKKEIILKLDKYYNNIINLNNNNE